MAWAAIQKIMTVANEAAGVVNGLFGSHFTGATLLATAGFLLLAKSLLDIPGYIKLIVAILSPFAAAFALVTAAVRGAGAGIDYVLGKIQYLADLLSDKLIDALHKLAGDDLWNGMKNAASATLGFIQSALEGIKSAAQNAWSAITGGGSSSPSSSSSPSGGAASSSSGSSHPSAADYSGVQRSWTPGHADGGQIKGPGTGTSDSILARLSNGEFVINAKAVAALGPRFFHALNNMELPGFAMGGLVMEPAFASGGMVSALASSAPSSSSGSKRIGFSLDLFGQSYHGLSGPAETLDALERHSAALQMAATSKRAPSRVR